MCLVQGGAPMQGSCPLGGQAWAENEFPNSVAVFLCSAFANTS